VFETRGLLVTIDGLGRPEDVTDRIVGAIDARVSA
jgi:hypothetical protein